MIAERIAAIEHETLIIDVEGADQDGAQVGWEYTATGMRFFIRGALAATLRALAARVVELEARMARLQALVGEQAEDEGLWFLARTCPEGYLQQELRRLHAAVENWPLADGGEG